MDPTANDKVFVSCCAIVKNIQRKIFFLPRNVGNEEALQDVYFEIKDVMERNKVTLFRVKVESSDFSADTILTSDVV